MEFPLNRAEADGFPAERVDITVVEDGDPVVVHVAGNVLYDTLAPLAELLDRLVSGPGRRLILDLSQVPMCDSSGLNLLVRTQAKLSADDGWLRLAGTQPMVDSVLHITNLNRVFPRYASVEEARR